MLKRLQRITAKKEVDAITLFTTPQCNLNCIYCFTKGKRRESCGLPERTWRSVIAQARKIGAKNVLFAGPGEPLLEKMNLSLIEYANSLKMTSTLFTNGTLITEDIAAFLWQHNVTTTIKIHSFNPALFDLLAGRKNASDWTGYEYYSDRRINRHLVPQGLKYLLEQSYKNSQRGTKQRLRHLRIESVITRYNLDSIVDIARFIRAHRLDFLFETLILPSKEELNHLIPNKEEYARLYKDLKKCLGLRFALRQNQINCSIRNNPVIWENGEAALCLVQDAKIGNIQNETLQTLWQRRKSIREERLKQRKCYGFRNCVGREYETNYTNLSADTTNSMPSDLRGSQG